MSGAAPAPHPGGAGPPGAGPSGAGAAPGPLPRLDELTIFFIVEPPGYQNLACYLAASIRHHLGGAVRLLGLCPEDRLAEVSPEVALVLARLDCPLQGFARAGAFDPPYPHGNKLLACAHPRATRWGCFLDSDVLLLNGDTPFARFMASGAVCASAAASLLWAEDGLWPPLYAAFDLPLPARDFRLMRDRRRRHRPYYSAGFVLFPEHLPDGRRFGAHWLEVAQRIDRMAAVPGRRPYLDQIALPLAIASSGLGYCQIPEPHHFILGGKLRRRPFDPAAGVSLVHYRGWKLMQETGLDRYGYEALRETAGHRKIRGVWARHRPRPVRG